MERQRIIEVVGPNALTEAAVWLDEAHERSGVSLMARRQWLQSWADAFTGWELWVLAYADADGIRAVAPLARRRAWWGLEVVLVGHTELNDAPVAQRDDEAVTQLATELVRALEALGSPWTLQLRQLPVRSAWSTALLAQLSTTAVFAGAPRPEIRFADDRAPDRWLTRNTRNALAKARNRISKEGHRLQVEWVDAWSRIEDVVPELATVHRERDLLLRGASLLDDPDEAAFYHAVIRRHTPYWRLLAVRIDGSLAAYALCLRDGDTLRVWDNRVAPAWMRYSAGLIANAEVVVTAARDPSTTTVDWGCGEQRYKTSFSSAVIETQTFEAWSSPMLRAALSFRDRLPAAARRLSTSS